MASTSRDFSKYIYTPVETATAGYQEVERIQKSAKTGIDWPPIPCTDISEYIARIMPWEIVAILAQTHNGKTMLFDWLETKICTQLTSEDRKEEAIVHVSVEENLEAMSFYQHAKYLGVPVSDVASGFVPLEKLNWSFQKIVGVPVYRIADSMGNPDQEQPELYLSNIYRMIKELMDGKVIGSPVNVAAVFIDYLQALPLDPEVQRANEENKRRLQVRNDVYRLRRMTTHIGAPIFVNVQAKQHLEGARAPYRIPGMYDGEETASIAQRFDRIFCMWMPKNDYGVGTQLEGIGTVTDELSLIQCRKQRGGLPSGKIWPLKWDYNARELLSITGKTVAHREAEAAAARDYVGD